MLTSPTLDVALVMVTFAVMLIVSMGTTDWLRTPLSTSLSVAKPTIPVAKFVEVDLAAPSKSVSVCSPLNSSGWPGKSVMPRTRMMRNIQRLSLSCGMSLIS